MDKNELLRVIDFEKMLGFHPRETNNFIGKNDRQLPNWILPHIHNMNKVNLRKFGSSYYPFNTEFVNIGVKESRMLKIERTKRIKLERELLIMQGKYEQLVKQLQSVRVKTKIGE